MIAQIRLAIEMLLQQRLNGRGIEKITIRASSFAQRLHQQRTQRSAQPFMRGNIEAGFLAFQNRLSAACRGAVLAALLSDARRES